jgi:micrococcal nuclease
MTKHMHITTKRMTTVITTLIVLFLAFGQQLGWFKAARQQATTAQPGLYAIDHFIDGDTISVNMNGRKESVRLIGVDTPETHRPNTPVQCYGVAAAAYTKNTIGNQKVKLVADPTNQNRDRYGRLLRYVYLPDGRLLDEDLVANGYGFAYTLFPFQKKAEFVQAEAQAKAAGKGLWGNCSVTISDGRKQTNAAE